MLKKTMTYTDFDGNKRKEDFWFNLTEQEINKYNITKNGGLKKLIEDIIATQDQARLVNLFEEIIQMSYGVRTLDGRGFMKSPEILANFICTQAYSDLYMELITNEKAASDFINGIVPATTTNANAEIIEKEANIIEMPVM